jgi:hypothetical protein
VQAPLERALHAGLQFARDGLGGEQRGDKGADGRHGQRDGREGTGDGSAGRARCQPRGGSEGQRPGQEGGELQWRGRALRVLADEVLARREIGAQRVLEGDQGQEGREPNEHRAAQPPVRRQALVPVPTGQVTPVPPRPQ